MARQLTAFELKARLDQGNKDFTLLDVREPWECGVCRFPGSTSIPLRELPARAAELPKDKEIVVVCHHGTRSQYAAIYLERAGFTMLNNLVGGIDAWARAIDPQMPTY